MMKKRTIAVVAGLVTAFILVAAGEWIAHQIYPPSPDIDLTDKQALAQLLQQTPAPAFLLLVLAHLIAAFAGGFVAGKLSAESSIVSAIIVGGVLTVAGFATLLMLPGHPIWFWILDLIVYIPFAVLGFKSGNQGSVSTEQ